MDGQPIVIHRRITPPGVLATKPEHIVLCPQTCERVSATSSAKVSVSFGCKRNDVVH